MISQKYKILILSNPNNKEFIEDLYIATSFREDGHLVDLLRIDYDEKLDNNYDVIIRRNTWGEYVNYLKNVLDEYKENIYQYVNNKIFI